MHVEVVHICIHGVLWLFSYEQQQQKQQHRYPQRELVTNQNSDCTEVLVDVTAFLLASLTGMCTGLLMEAGMPELQPHHWKAQPNTGHNAQKAALLELQAHFADNSSSRRNILSAALLVRISSCKAGKQGDISKELLPFHFPKKKKFPLSQTYGIVLTCVTESPTPCELNVSICNKLVDNT